MLDTVLSEYPNAALLRDLKRRVIQKSGRIHLEVEIPANHDHFKATTLRCLAGISRAVFHFLYVSPFSRHYTRVTDNREETDEHVHVALHILAERQR
ncbi:hypothetical protein [Horticoccus sp. 23ND18S-11]|uniref:hypothetical protein n=1 Tax=Horticoccus sp. 23ND18S-11 TaxID=3391832 RepID=UPI0039C9F05E